MNIIEASQDIIKLYQKQSSDFSSEKEMEVIWKNAIDKFDRALKDENNLGTLEKCIFNDINWELHVEGRLKILKKAKSLGANSEKFLKDYYGYLAAHLDPSDEKETADKELKRLLSTKTMI